MIARTGSSTDSPKPNVKKQVLTAGRVKTLPYRIETNPLEEEEQILWKESESVI